MIRYGGRPVRGFALGQAIDPFIKSENDLATQMQPAITLGDQYLAGLVDPPSALLILHKTKESAAIDAYAKAGAIGVSVIGPEIDAAGQQATTSPIVQQAAASNQELVAIGNKWFIGPPDAARAQSLAKSMADSYARAIAAGRAATGVPASPAAPAPPPLAPPANQPSATPPPPPSSSPPSPDRSRTWVILIPVTAAAALAGVYLARK